MILAGVLVLVTFIVVAVMLSRQTTRTKKRAVADLETEKETVGAFDILALVESEVNALDLAGIEGADGIPPSVLLKVWSSNDHVVNSCVDRAGLRYVVAEGVDPTEASESDVTLECTNVEATGDTRPPTDEG
jgi:hypothetical protein